jgi:hypothetical protein
MKSGVRRAALTIVTDLAIGNDPEVFYLPPSLVFKRAIFAGAT